MKEVIFRILSIPFYPIAYILKDKIKVHLHSIDELLVKERTWGDTQNISTKKFFSEVNKLYFFLWCMLDDSPAKDSFFRR